MPKGLLEFDVAGLHVDVKNTGHMDGTHTLLVFSMPPVGKWAPEKHLVGFETVHVVAGGRQRVKVDLDVCKHLSVVDQFGIRRIQMVTNLSIGGSLVGTTSVPPWTHHLLLLLQVIGSSQAILDLDIIRYYSDYRAALKKGFNKGCRPLVGVDGCHLKGPGGGQLLAAVSIDDNNQIYHVAYAVVEIENTSSWLLFLSHVMNDLEIPNDPSFAIISDKQKAWLFHMQPELSLLGSFLLSSFTETNKEMVSVERFFSCFETCQFHNCRGHAGHIENKSRTCVSILWTCVSVTMHLHKCFKHKMCSIRESWLMSHERLVTRCGVVDYQI
ncbi:uncharacterized protein LOC130760597 [Actinidia eriantha]|uniref:uncharacterized protein LOC130760597 n=1 Tax=Actinidia eriantha TaxID=165200 RepID=UPI00258ECD4A|nr:uncharacterized protein LOC130760597 [Actinidia eriantha]